MYQKKKKKKKEEEGRGLPSIEDTTTQRLHRKARRTDYSHQKQY